MGFATNWTATPPRKFYPAEIEVTAEGDAVLLLVRRDGPYENLLQVVLAAWEADALASQLSGGKR